VSDPKCPAEPATDLVGVHLRGERPGGVRTEHDENDPALLTVQSLPAFGERGGHAVQDAKPYSSAAIGPTFWVGSAEQLMSRHR
jgi:hypothetical protein